MKTVRFHESINGGIGSKKATLRGQFKGKRKGKRISQSLIVLGAAKAAGAYEAIKNEDLHEAIIKLSHRNVTIELFLTEILNCLKDERDPPVTMVNIETGLQNLIARKATLPSFENLDNKTTKLYLSKLAAEQDFAKLLTATSEIASNDVSLGNTLYSIEVDGNKSGQETATQLVLQAAFEESKRRGLSIEEFKEECTNIFNAENEYYDSAFEKVTEQDDSGKVGKDEGKMSLRDWIEKVLDLIDHGTQILNNDTQEQANSDSGSVKSYASNFDAMKNVALTAFVKWGDVIEISYNDSVVLYFAIFQVVS